MRQCRSARALRTRNSVPEFTRRVAELIIERATARDTTAAITAALAALQDTWCAVRPRCRRWFSPKVYSDGDLPRLQGIAVHGPRADLDAALLRIYAAHKAACPWCGRRTRLGGHFRLPETQQPTGPREK